jgi:hypothetical protein
MLLKVCFARQFRFINVLHGMNGQHSLIRSDLVNKEKLAWSVKDPNRPNRLLCAAEKEISNVEPS